MAKVKIKREEVEKFLKDHLGFKEIKWNKDGSCDVEMTLKEVRENNKIYYVPTPVYVPTPITPYRPYRPYGPWTVTCGTTSSKGMTTSPYTATYSSSSEASK